MFYVFLLLVAAIGGLIYFWFMFQSVPGMAEERFGELEPLPPDVGVWKRDEDSAEAHSAKERGLAREIRLYYDESSQRLYRQVRYRSLATDDIVETEPDELVKRKRVKPTTKA
ncbi:MAG: hypothetical protein DIU78_011995 [Pseudomonadota bacterium]|nr:MAG: hypothetical protein DIU78_02580 [Pseudomonadota bacterium]